MNDDPDQRPIRHNGYVGPKERQCDGKSRFQLEAKKDLKKADRLGRSPDRADSPIPPTRSSP